MASYVNGIGAADYDYELPDNFTNHIANSNSTILSVLNAAGVDLRTIPSPISATNPNPASNSAPYLDAGFYTFNFPGATDAADPTLLGSGVQEIIEASVNQARGLSILGRDLLADYMIGTKYQDRYFGAHDSDNGSLIDTVSFERLPTDLGNSTGLTDVRFKLEPAAPGWTDAYPEFYRSIGVYGVNQSASTPDYLFGVDKVALTGDPPRVCRRLVYLSQAASLAGSSRLA